MFVTDSVLCDISCQTYSMYVCMYVCTAYLKDLYSVLLFILKVEPLLPLPIMPEYYVCLIHCTHINLTSAVVHVVDLDPFHNRSV